MRLAIIIPVYNQLEQLARCLAALSHQSVPITSCSVWVVDNASSPNQCASLIAAQFPYFHFLVEPKPGSYAARNTGVRQSNSEWLAFIDADCVPAPDWLERGLAAIDSDPESIFAGAVHPILDSRSPGLLARFDAHFGIPQQAMVSQSRSAATANLWLPRRIWIDLDGFDETCFSGGDIDFCSRAMRRGFGIRYVASAIVSHPARASFRELRIKARRMAARRWREFGWLGFGRDLLPPVRLFHRLLKTTPSIPFADCIGFSALTWLNCLWMAAEKLRLLCGSVPERR